MKVLKDQTIENELIVLEEVYIVNCTLKNCQLLYSGGQYQWEKANFVDCQFRFLGPAKNMMSFLNQVGLLKMSKKTPVVTSSSTEIVN